MNAAEGSRKDVHFLPEPERQERFRPIISVDDHIVEPPDIFEGRVPARLAERAPRVVQTSSGFDTWLYDGELLPNIGLNAVVGRPPAEYSREPTSFDDMRKGSWDIHHRIADMNIDGVLASLNFPSFLPGFGGGRIQTVTDNRDLALAAKMLESYLAGSFKTEEAPAFIAHTRLARVKLQLGDAAGAERERAAALALAHEYRPAQDLKLQETKH